MANSYRCTQLKCERMDTPCNLQAGAFAGTAEAYFRYRPPYPKALLASLVTQARLPGSAVLLDLACGPGRATLDLAASFAARTGVPSYRHPRAGRTAWAPQM